MPRLAKALSGGRSQDIITNPAVPVVQQDKFEEGVKAKSSPVKTTLDLSLFRRFGEKDYVKPKQKAMWFKVDARGSIIITNAIGRHFSDEQSRSIPQCQKYHHGDKRRG